MQGVRVERVSGDRRERDDVLWFAGYLEGEGSFILDKARPGILTSRQPRISVSTTDFDIARKVAAILDSTVSKPYVPKKVNHSQFYKVELTGSRSIGWMMTIYLLMGIRRKKKIRECISVWKSAPVMQSSISKLWKKSKYERLVEQWSMQLGLL